MVELGSPHTPINTLGSQKASSYESLHLPIALRSLAEDGAKDTVVIPLAGKSLIADNIVIASGSSCRHIGSLAENLVRRLKKAKLGKPSCEGLEACEWVLVDAGSLIAHLFLPDIRRFYDLETLWDINPAE